MGRLCNVVRTNSILVAIVSAIGLLSAIVSLVSGWSAFIDWLQRPLMLPMWGVALIVIFAVVCIAIHIERRSEPDFANPKLKLIANAIYDRSALVLDGKHFVNCKFNGTDIILEGSAPFSLEHCQFNNVRFRAEKFADLTLSALGALSNDPGMAHIVDATFDNLRRRRT